MSSATKIIVLRESLPQSLVSDAVTLATLFLCLFVSIWVGSAVFSVIMGTFFVWSLVHRLVAFAVKSGGVKMSPDEAIQYINKIKEGQ